MTGEPAAPSRPAYRAGPLPPDGVELRVVGCLIEKQRTTPDAYPLSINALRTACNQATNRDPVVDFDDELVLAAVERLGRRGWVRFASGTRSRARKYRHILDEALVLGDSELALLCVLMLRGPQTPGELKQRAERLHAFAGLDEVDSTLETLVERDLAQALPRRPGQKEQRYVQMLEGEPDDEAPSPDAAAGAEAAQDAPAAAAGTLPPGTIRQAAEVGTAERLANLEREVAALRAALDELRAELGA